MEGAHEVVASGLGCRVGRVRIVFRCLEEELLAVGQMVLSRRGCGGEWRLNALGVGELECSVDLIGGDVVEAARN